MLECLLGFCVTTVVFNVHNVVWTSCLDVGCYLLRLRHWTVGVVQPYSPHCGCPCLAGGQVYCQTADASTTLAAGSTQNWLQGVCVDIQDSEHVCTAVPQPTHQSPRQRMDTTLVGYATAHPTVRSYRLRETFFSMCRAVCLELTSRVCHRKRLIVCIQI